MATDVLAEMIALSTPLETKAEIVAYYQATYPGLGRGGWKQHIAHDLQPFTVSEKNPEGMKIKNLEKRFDSGAKEGKQPRLNNPEPRNAEQYRELGLTLPPVPPRGGFMISGIIWVKYSESCEEREIDPPMHITFEDAVRMLAMTPDKSLQAVANGYQSDQMDGDIDFKGPNICNPPDLIVEAVEEEE